MTFSHNTASVNGIRLHYVIGGHGDPVVLLHGWSETWYEFRLVMPALAKNCFVAQLTLPLIKFGLNSFSLDEAFIVLCSIRINITNRWLDAENIIT